MRHDPVARLSAAETDRLVGSWSSGLGLSDHAELEIAAAVQQGHEPGDPPPLAGGDPVPGCGGVRCLALAKGCDQEEAELARAVVSDLARLTPKTRLRAGLEIRKTWEAAGLWLPSAGWLCRRASEQEGAVEPEPDPGDRDRDELPVEEARRVSILEVARRLGLGDPERRGSEYVVTCPLHDDHDPSLRLNPEKGPPGGVWRCWPCVTGGDGIDLVRATRDCGFPEAVRWIARGGR